MEVALLNIGVHVFAQLLSGEKLGKVGQLALLLHGVCCVGIGGEDIGKLLRADGAGGCGSDSFFKV